MYIVSFFFTLIFSTIFFLYISHFQKNVRIRFPKIVHKNPTARMEVFRFIPSYPFLHYLTYLFSRLRPPLLRGWRQSDSRGPVILTAEGGVPPA